MWMNGSNAARSTPAKARRTGKPSPSKPLGADVTDTTGRGTDAVGSGAIRGRTVRSSTVMAGIRVSLDGASLTCSLTVIACATIPHGRGCPQRHVPSPHRSGRALQELRPGRVADLAPAQGPGRTPRGVRVDAQGPAHLVRRTVALHAVAAQAAG